MGVFKERSIRIFFPVMNELVWDYWEQLEHRTKYKDCAWRHQRANILADKLIYEAKLQEKKESQNYKKAWHLKPPLPQVHSTHWRQWRHRTLRTFTRSGFKEKWSSRSPMRGTSNKSLRLWVWTRKNCANRQHSVLWRDEAIFKWRELPAD